MLGADVDRNRFPASSTTAGHAESGRAAIETEWNDFGIVRTLSLVCVSFAESPRTGL